MTYHQPSYKNFKIKFLTYDSYLPSKPMVNTTVQKLGEPGKKYQKLGYIQKERDVLDFIVS
jgi:hypothetical protein